MSALSWGHAMHVCDWAFLRGQLQMHYVGKFAAKSEEASSAVAAAETITGELHSAHEQVRSLQSQLSQAQSLVQSLKEQQLADQQRALASQASLTVNLKDKTSQLDSMRDTLSALTAKLQQVQASSADTEALQQQTQRLQAELNAECEAHDSLKQKHAGALAEAASTSSSLSSALESKSAELKKAAQALVAKDSELQEAVASLKKSQDQASALQARVQELMDSSQDLQSKLDQQQLACADLQKQHTERKQAAAAKEADLMCIISSKETEHQKASASLAEAEANLKALTTHHEVSCGEVASLEVNVEELTQRCVQLQQQLQSQTDLLTRLQQEHPQARQAPSSEDGEVAASITDLESQLQTLRQSLSAKDAEVLALQQALHEQATAKTELSQQQTHQADAAAAEISQLQQQVTAASTKVKQLESHTEHLRKMLGDRTSQYSQLLAQHQALQAMAAEAAQEGDQQEADLRQKDNVIQQLQQQLLTAQHILDGTTARREPAQGAILPSAPTVLEDNTVPTHQAGQCKALPTVDPTPNLATPTSTNNSVTTGKQQVPCLHPTSRGLQAITPVTRPASLGGNLQPAPTNVSAKAAVSPSLSMPAGSVTNPLAGQPDLDNRDPNDHSSRSKLRPLSPQLSGLISDSDSDTNDCTYIEDPAGLVVVPHAQHQAASMQSAASMPDVCNQKKGARGGERGLKVVSAPSSHALEAAGDWQQPSIACQEMAPQMQQVGLTLSSYLSFVFLGPTHCQMPDMLCERMC